MDLVDDIYPVFELRRCKNDLIAYVSYIIHSVVRRGVHLENIGSRSLLDSAACVTDSAGFSVYRMLAVDRLCKYLCAGSLSHSARTAKEVCMTKLTVFNFVTKDRSDMLLSVNIIKALRSPFAIKCLMHSITPFP